MTELEQFNQRLEIYMDGLSENQKKNFKLFLASKYDDLMRMTPIYTAQDVQDALRFALENTK